MLITEKFLSYQSEGKYVNTPALFIRLSGCNCDCSFCDESYDDSYDISIDEINSFVKYNYYINNIRLLVITGGEPTLQFDEVQECINVLNNNYDDLVIQVESNGVNKKIFSNCVTCISPKKYFNETFKYYYKYDNVFFKFVIRNIKDIRRIVELKKIYNYDKDIYLQAEYNNMEEVVKLIIDNYYLLDNNFKFSFQTHKWVDVL